MANIVEDIVQNLETAEISVEEYEFTELKLKHQNIWKIPRPCRACAHMNFKHTDYSDSFNILFSTSFTFGGSV